VKKVFVTILLVLVVLGLHKPSHAVRAAEFFPPLNVNVSNDRTDSIHITWDDNPGAGSGVNNGVVILYRLQGSTTFLKLANVLHGTNEYFWYSAKPGKIYEFQIGYCGASDQFYLCDYPWVYLFDGTIYSGWRKLVKPTSFSASKGSSADGVFLGWNKHPQQDEPGFFYRIWSSTSEFGPYAILTSVTTNSYADSTMILIPAVRRLLIMVIADYRSLPV